MQRFDKQIALVTGGSTGMGLATARTLAERGATVIITGRDQRKLLAAQEGSSRPDVLVPIVADNGQLTDLDTLVSKIRRRFRKFSSYLSHLWFDCGSFCDLII